MKALYCPGPSYFDASVKDAAGWWHILEMQSRALEQADFEVVVAPPELPFYEPNPPIARYLTYGLPHAALARQVDLILGAPSYAFLPFLYGPQAKKISYGWNNASWWRRQQLEEEYRRFGSLYSETPASELINTCALEVCDHVIACSPWVKQTFSHLVPAERISIAFWGVDSQKFTPATTEPPGFRVLFLGGDPIRKGLGYLIEAFTQLVLGEHLNMELWIAGCNIRLDGAQLPVKQLGLVPHAKVPDLYRQCSVLVCPTLEDGIACVVQEAMASGLVPIASPDAAEVFEDGISGLKVGFRDIEGIKNALRTLYQDPEKRRTMAQAARALAETQTWEKTCKDFAEVIRRVVEGKGKLPFESGMPWLKGHSWTS